MIVMLSLHAREKGPIQHCINSSSDTISNEKADISPHKLSAFCIALASMLNARLGLIYRINYWLFQAKKNPSSNKTNCLTESVHSFLNIVLSSTRATNTIIECQNLLLSAKPVGQQIGIVVSY